jgi:hypothetical protein
MICKDISRCLDERELAALSASESAELKMHIAQCADCAAQTRISFRLSSFRSEIPPFPASLREQARRLDAVCESAEGDRCLRRPVIVGGLFLFGALATMLVTGRWRGGGAAEAVE